MELEGGPASPSWKSRGWTPPVGVHRVRKLHTLLARELEKQKDGLRGEPAAHLPPARDGSQQRRGVVRELQPHLGPCPELQASEQPSWYLMLLVGVSR